MDADSSDSADLSLVALSAPRSHPPPARPRRATWAGPPPVGPVRSTPEGTWLLPCDVQLYSFFLSVKSMYDSAKRRPNKSGVFENVQDCNRQALQNTRKLRPCVEIDTL